MNVPHPGAFFLIIGWNASFARDGLARIRMSDYLEEAQGGSAVTEAQAGLEELLFDYAVVWPGSPGRTAATCTRT